jgi:hypothetical protein
MLTRVNGGRPSPLQVTMFDELRDLLWPASHAPHLARRREHA